MPNTDDEARARLQVLTTRERDRLAGILARLSSPHDGERAAAGLLASAFVAKHNLEWADLAGTLRPVAAPAAIASAPVAPRDRRGSPKATWYGYCRRRLARLGQALNWLS